MGDIASGYTTCPQPQQAKQRPTYVVPYLNLASERFVFHLIKPSSFDLTATVEGRDSKIVQVSILST